MDWSSLWSSDFQAWATPPEFMDRLHDHLGIKQFDLDAAALPFNKKAPKYIGPPSMRPMLDKLPAEHHPVAIDSRLSSWGGHGEYVFFNPPYGRDVGPMMDAAVRNAYKHRITVATLTFMRSDTKWFQRNAFAAHEWLVVQGRLKFLGADGKPLLDKHGRPQSAPAPSVVLIFDGWKPRPESPTVRRF